MASSLPTLLLLTLSSLSTLSAAYTWNFATPPQQCSNLTVSLVGSGGVPPYRLLVLPSGPTPLSSGVEVRTILDVPFPDDSTTVSFQLKYPAFSQLVAVVSILLYFLFLSFFSSFFCSSHGFWFLLWCCQGHLCQCFDPPRGYISHWIGSSFTIGLHNLVHSSSMVSMQFLLHTPPISCSELVAAASPPQTHSNSKNITLSFPIRQFRFFLIACGRLPRL